MYDFLVPKGGGCCVTSAVQQGFTVHEVRIIRTCQLSYKEIEQKQNGDDEVDGDHDVKRGLLAVKDLKRERDVERERDVDRGRV